MEFHDCEDDLRPMKGVANGVVYGVILWVLLLAAVLICVLNDMLCTG
jgi:hypothetical protein